MTDPGLPTSVVATAVTGAATRAGQRQQLAWALQDRPELLTGGRRPSRRCCG
ncbi:MAG: hypothetical protein ACLQDY_30355 [Streptosporangiaceae bacterium]